MLNHPVVQILLVLVALVSAVGGIYSAIKSSKKTDAEAEATSDKTWITRLDALSKDLGKLQALSDERFERLVELETLITEHVTWDFRVVRMLREHGLECEDPPSLVYVRRKLAEEKNAIRQEMGLAGGGEELRDSEGSGGD